MRLETFRCSFVCRVFPLLAALWQEYACDIFFEIGRQRLPESGSFVDRVQELL
jgi:hypothetical protein